ncbi:MAG TPA: hypothetical protein VIV40_26220 [Kofleriaceae bacterium]
MKKSILVLALCACQTPPRPTTPTAPTATDVAELAARRTQMIAWLREYYEAGEYPVDDTGKPISVFKDARGVRCPMAELITRSGHGDLVDAVAIDNNKLRLADVKDGPIYDWMATSGLTIEEIAMVQGAMDIDYSWMRIEQPNQETIMARGQVRGRLETAVTALTGATPNSVTIAAKRLAARSPALRIASPQPGRVASPVAKSIAGPRAIRTVADGSKETILRP